MFVNRTIQNLDGFQMMSPRQGHTADVIGDYLFVFGGFDLNQVMYSFVKLDMISGIWSDVLVDLSCISIPTGELPHSYGCADTSLVVTMEP